MLWCGAEELSGSVRQDLVMDKGVEHGGENADEIDRETREQMVGLDEVVRRHAPAPPAPSSVGPKT